MLDYLSAAPDSLLGYRYAPGVRNFAEQIDHAASAAAFIVSQVVMGASPPAALKGDTAVYLHDKAALRNHVNAQYDYVVNILKTIPDSSLLAEKEGFKIRKAAWRWAESAREHAVWTLGQTVPYMRNNKVRPPNFLPF